MRKKNTTLSKPFYVTGDIENDIKKLKTFFNGVKGKVLTILEMIAYYEKYFERHHPHQFFVKDFRLF